MPPKGTKVVAQNRKARHDYEVLETYEAGLQLKGSEVKSLRAGQVQMREAYARVDDGEIWVHGLHIAPYSHASSFGVVDPDRTRKLLMHKREIEELGSRTTMEPLTIVPMAIYFKDGKAKIEVALARGRKRYDKRQAIAQRDSDREAERAHRSRQKGE